MKCNNCHTTDNVQDDLCFDCHRKLMARRVSEIVDQHTFVMACGAHVRVHWEKLDEEGGGGEWLGYEGYGELPY